MAGRVAVVTDCTACLPAELAPQLGVTVVPLRIVAGGLAADDGPGVLDGPLGGELRRGQRLSTARPGPAKFAAAYAAAAGSGAAAVVSVHLSGQLSGTVRSARLAAAGAALPVHVVDSLSIGMGLGFGVLAAARAAPDGEAGGAGGAAEFAAGRPVDLAIQHLGNAERAAELSRRLAAAIPAAPTSRVAEAGAAILAHTGPGMLGVVVSPC